MLIVAAVIYQFKFDYWNGVIGLGGNSMKVLINRGNSIGHDSLDHVHLIEESEF